MTSLNRILLVHHNGKTRRRLRLAIESLGPDFSVDDVRSGEEAFLEFMRQPVDLLVVGLSLLGMSGLELVERARVRKPDVKVIALSGSATRDLERRARRLGIDAILPSDVDPARFIASVEEIFGISEEILAPAEESPPPPVAASAISQEPPQKESSASLLPVDELTRPSLSVPLTRLRHSLDALSVTLLNDHGRVLAQAGDYPDLDTGSRLMSALTTSLSSSLKVTSLLGGGPEHNFIAFQGGSENLFMLTMQDAFALTAVLPANSQISWDVLRQDLERTGDILMGVFRDLGLLSTEPPAAPLPQTGSLDSTLLSELPVADEALDALFQEIPKELPDADTFWESLTTEEAVPDTATLNLADALSYEEALRLGLVPSDEEETS